MLEIVRTKSSNCDFRVLVTILDRNSKIDFMSIKSVFSAFNSVELTDTAVVVYANDMPVGCRCILKIDNDNIEFKNIYTRFEYREKGIKEMIMAELEKWAEELGYHKGILEDVTK